MVNSLQRPADAAVPSVPVGQSCAIVARVVYGGAQLGMHEDARGCMAMRVTHLEAATAVPVGGKRHGAHRTHVRVMGHRVDDLLLGSRVVRVGPAVRELWRRNSLRINP